MRRTGVVNPGVDVDAAAGGARVTELLVDVGEGAGSVLINAEAALRWLRQPEPDHGEAIAALEAIVRDGRRVGEAARSLARACADKP
jgi:hypothetical protein